MNRTVELAAAAGLGAVMGSFMYVVGLNLGRLETIVRRRSCCPHCGHQLRWFELLPVVSYLVQRGRCRLCQAKLTSAYFWSEIGLALLFASLYWWTAPSSIWSLVCLWLAVSGWFGLFIDDWRTLSIDVGLFWRLAWFSSLAAVVVEGLSRGDLGGVLWGALFGALFGGGLLWLIRVVGSRILRREAMGDGDPPVGALVGMVVGGFVGWPSVILTLLLSFIIGSLIGVVPMLWTRRFDSMKEVPYTPALFLAGWLALLWGPAVVTWYLWML